MVRYGGFDFTGERFEINPRGENTFQDLGYDIQILDRQYPSKRLMNQDGNFVTRLFQFLSKALNKRLLPILCCGQGQPDCNFFAGTGFRQATSRPVNNRNPALRHATRSPRRPPSLVPVTGRRLRRIRRCAGLA